jgi:hypothetical protein
MTLSGERVGISMELHGLVPVEPEFATLTR